MQMSPFSRCLPVVGTALSAVLLLVPGCDFPQGPAEAPTDEVRSAVPDRTSEGAGAVALSEGLPAAVNREIAALRRATARFHRVSEAEDAGYEVLVTHPTTGAACLDHPSLGAMGRHLLKPDLVDDEVSVLEPEVVIYEPGPNGRLRLVGFEYIIPFEIRGREEDPPVLFGQEFVQNETFDLWALHVWAWKHNPSGMFADWNPAVSCDFDELVDG